MTARGTKRGAHRPARLRAFDGLVAWQLTSAGLEAQRVVSVGRTKWTVCYKVHDPVAPDRVQGEHHAVAEGEEEARLAPAAWKAP
jgi:hypothetical protein